MKNSQTFSIRNSKKKAILAGLFFLLLVLIVCSLCSGAVRLSPADILHVLINPQDHSLQGSIFLLSRVPRTCGSVLAGMAFAASGAVIQTVLNNPLAAPNIIGVNSGAGLAVALVSLAGTAYLRILPAAAMAGALCGAAVVLVIAGKTGASRMTTILAGIAVSSIFSAFIDAIITLAPDTLVSYSGFRIGSLAGLTMSRIRPAFFMILPAFLLLLSLAKQMDVLMLGESTAHSLGMNVKRIRTILLVLAAFLTGAAVSFAGMIGFVGLIVPHIIRRAGDEDSLYVLLGSALGGAVLLTLCDIAARILFRPYEMPVGILLSLLGGPFFIGLLIKQRGGRIHD